MTAAGPGAGAGAPGSGSGEYADDPGALIDGIDRLGSLGTIYWGYDYEVPEQYLDENPSGGGSLSVITDLTLDPAGRIEVGVFEDARPYQYLESGQDIYRYGQMQFAFSGSGTTVCDFVNMTGFHVGAVIYLGDPTDPATPSITITDINQTVRVPADQFSNGGVFLEPPANSDADMDITSTLDIRAESSGNTAVVPGPSFVVIVDAVADLPDFKESTADGVVYSGPTKASEFEETREDGFIKHDMAEVLDDRAGVSVSIPIEVTATFYDYGKEDPTDVGEQHYILIQRPPAAADGTEWTCVVDGVTYGADDIITLKTKDGVPLADQNSDDFDGYADFFQIPVSNETLQQIQQANPDQDEPGATVTINAELQNDNYVKGMEQDEDNKDGEAGTADDKLIIWTGAMADEGEGSDRELRTDNNQSYTFNPAGKHELSIDIIDSTLNVNLGWFYEDGDGTKHGVSPHDVPGAVAGGTNDGKSAVVQIYLDGADANDHEYISEIILTYDSNLGTLDTTALQAAGWTVDPQPGANGKISVILTPPAGTTPDALPDGSVVFKPNADFSDQDIPVSYEITVVDGDSGASAVFSHDSVVYVDAVADRPTDADIDNTVDSGANCVAPGKTATVEGKAAFDDNDGSESHFVVVTLQQTYLDKGWSFTGLNDSLLSKDAINDHWLKQMGAPYETMAELEAALGDTTLANHDMLQALYDQMLSILTPGGNQGASADAQYLLIEAYPISGSDPLEYGVRFWASDGSGGLLDVTSDVDPDGSSRFDMGSGELIYDVQVTAPDAGAGSSEATLYTKAITVETETDGHKDGEYDYSNNIAVNENGADWTTIKSAEATSTLKIETALAFEGNNANKHGGEQVETVLDPNGAEAVANAGKITITHVNGVAGNTEDPALERVNAIMLTHDANGEGVIKVMDAWGNPAITIPEGGGLVFATKTLPDGTILYTGAYVVDADGDTIGTLMAKPTSGQTFDDFMSGIDLRYVPDSGSYSDVDVNIDIVASITDPNSGDTKVISSDPDWKADTDNDPSTVTFGDKIASGEYTQGDAIVRDDLTGGEAGLVVVDAVADKPVVTISTSTDPDKDAVDYARDANGTEYKAARPGDTVTLKGEVTFKDYQDGSEDHSILVQASNANGTVITIVINGVSYDVSDPANLPDGVTTVQHNGVTYFKVDVDNDVKDFNVSATVQVGDAATKDTPYSINIGGYAEEMGTDTDPRTSGGEVFDINNESTGLAPVTYNVAPAQGKLLFVAGSAYEGNDPNQHVDPLAPVSNKAKGLQISVSNGDNEQITKIYLQYDAEGQGVIKVGDVTIPSGTFITLGADGKYACTGIDANGNEVPVTLTTAQLANGTIKYVPFAESDSDAEVPIGIAATIVDPDSGDTVVSTNIDSLKTPDPDAAGKAILDEMTKGSDDGKGGEQIKIVDEDGSSKSSVVVDAVADRPVDLKVPEEATYPDKAGQTGVEKEAAAPGDTVSIDVTVGFKDYIDSSERQFIVVERPAVGKGDPQWSCAQSEGLLQPGDGNTYFRIEVTDEIDALVVQMGQNPAEGVYTKTFDNGITVTIEVDANGNWSAATVTTTVDLKVPETGINADYTEEVSVGGVAMETEGLQGIDANGKPKYTLDPSEELDTANNIAVNTDPVDVKIGVTESRPTIELEGPAVVYENNLPWAYTDEVNQPTGGPGSADRTEGVGAKVILHGMAGGESAKIVFTIDFAEGTAGKEDGPMGSIVIYEYDENGNIVYEDGNPKIAQEFEFTFNEDTNQWECTVSGIEGMWDADNDGKFDSDMYFRPGENYSDADLSLGYDSIVITDLESGHQNDGSYPLPQGTDPWTGEGLGEITVDAVAWKPDVNTDAGNVFNEQNYVKGAFDLEMKAEFRDFDGSESHYVLVQYTLDADLSGDFKAFINGLADLFGMDRAQAMKIVPVYEKNGMGHQISADLLIEACGADPADLDPAALSALLNQFGVSTLSELLNQFGVSFENGSLTVNIAMVTSDAYEGKTIDLWTGALAQDLPTDSDLNGATPDGSDPLTNNRGVTFNDNTLNVGVIDSSVGGGRVFMYDDNSVTAAVGRNIAATGVEIDLNINLGVNDTVTSITFDSVSADGTLTLTYTVEGVPHALNIPADLPNGTLTFGPGQLFESYEDYLAAAPTYRYDQNLYSDTDGSVHYTVGFEDTKSGETGTRSGTVEILVDAKAQMPTALDEAATNAMNQVDGVLPTFHEGSQSKITLSASFKDFGDGSEKHYIAIEAQGGWNVIFADGTKAEVYEVNGKSYFLIPVDEACAKGEGTWVINGVTYNVTGSDAEGYTVRASFMLEASKDLYTIEVNGKTISNCDEGLEYGALAIDYARGDKTDSGAEFNYENNYAFDHGGTLEIDITGGTGGHNIIDSRPTFENATPLAHEGIYDKYEDNGLLIIGDNNGKYLGEDITSVTITIPGDANGPMGTLEGHDKGEWTTTDGGKTWSLTIPGDGTGLRYVPDRYDDADVVKLDCTITYGNGETVSGTTYVTVDAVAQQPDHLAVLDPDYAGTGTTAAGMMGANNQVELTLKATFQDFDGSEGHYMLLEKLPGMSVDRAGVGEIMGPDGKVYFTIPVHDSEVDSNGNATVTVTVTVDGAALERLGGSGDIPSEDLGKGVTQYELATGALSREENYDGELDYDNNFGFAKGDPVAINVSTVSLSVSVSVNQAYDDAAEGWYNSRTGQDEAAPAKAGIIVFSAAGQDGNDVIESISLGQPVISGTTTPQGSLEFWNGSDWVAADAAHLPTIPGASVTWSNGTLVITPDFSDSVYNGIDPTDKAALSDKFLSLLADQFRVNPGEFKGDLDLPNQVVISDGASADKTDPNHKANMDVDAVAQIGDDPSISSMTYYDKAGQAVSGAGALQPGGTVAVEIDITGVFTDQTAEGNYILVEQQNNWNGNYETITLNINGVTKVYFQIPVSAADIANGSITVTIKAPAQASADGTVDLEVRGMSVDQIGSGEQTLDNNVAFSGSDKLTLKVGVVETDSAALQDVILVESTGAWVDLSLGDNLAQTLAENGETVIRTELTFTQAGPTPGVAVGDTIATVKYGDQIIEVKVTAIDGSGNITAKAVIDTPNGFDFDADFEMQLDPDYHNSNPIDVNTATTVKDASGAVNETAFENESTITVTATADAATSIDAADVDVAQNNVVAGHKAEITLNIVGDFPDTDGSEQHFFLVQLPVGASINGTALTTLPAGCGLDLADGPVYRVTAAEAAALKVLINGPDTAEPFVDDSSIKIVAESVETSNGDTAYSAAESVDVSTDGVEFNLAPATKGNATVDGSLNSLRADTASGNMLDANKVYDPDGDSMSVAKVNGNSLVGSAPWTVTTDNGVLTINANGTYSYKLTNPDFIGKETFTYTVKDALGAESGQLKLVVTVTDTNTPPKGVVSEVSGSIQPFYEGEIAFTDKDGDAVFLTTINGATASWMNDVWAVAGEYGTLEVTRTSADGGLTYTYSYKYLTNADAVPGNVDSFTYKGVDAYGEPTSSDGKLTITMETLEYTAQNGETVDGTGLPGWDSGAVIDGVGNNTIFAGDGNDVITGGNAGSNEIHAGAGNDVIRAGNMGDEIWADSGNNTIYGGAGDDTIYGGSGDNVIYGGTGNDTIYGGTGNNTIYGNDPTGGTGNNTIYAGGSEGTTSTVYGGDGNDEIYAGLGNDVLYGGGGSDTFIWRMENFGGDDVIKDFSFQSDQISFSDIFADVSGLEILFTQTGTPRSFAFEAENGASIEATFFNNTTLELNVSKDGASQTITVQSNGFYAMDQNLDASLANEILQQIIKEYGG
ncbi:hypothetical protein KL86DPRO_11912 [uncultured delta proteobacterium]|uniref:Uncharacterized protein n=1 Tax=uncultured delta proteobacterium TaxID=34034 RepID=A0A212JP18_9DELT|nr:hypothetical protein KL86DPRO_11912 [uncultured delta proteobacterium]